MLVDGEVGVDTYRADRLDRSDVRRLSERVRFEAVHDPRPAAEQPGDLAVTLEDGTVVRLRTDNSSFGGSTTDLDEVVLAKFRLNVGASEDAAGRLVDAVMMLDDAPDLDAVASALRGVVDDWAVDRTALTPGELIS